MRRGDDARDFRGTRAARRHARSASDQDLRVVEWQGGAVLIYKAAAQSDRPLAWALASDIGRRENGRSREAVVVVARGLALQQSLHFHLY